MEKNKLVDGYIKFFSHLTTEKIEMPHALLQKLNYWREELWLKCLIGAYPDGIGYGNISVRAAVQDQFYITGSATGGIPELDMIHYALVEHCDLLKNAIWCRGVINASSESMTHAAIYAANPDIKAVVHVHSRPLWEKMLNHYPTTPPEFTYGTPEIAIETGRICSALNHEATRIIIMGGHEEGIIAIGSSVEEAATAILNLK